MSASAVNDSGFAQSNGNDDELESAAFGGADGGQATAPIARPSLVAYPAASWLEFTEWLERGLDGYGLEPTLYARCVLSILKQPPEPAADSSMEQDEEWAPTPAASFLSVVSHHVFGKNNSAPSSRKNSFGSLATATAAAGSATVKSDADTRKQALMDCLKSVSADETDLGKFVDDIVHRYSLVAKSGVLGEKQNESVDSGVCPSPEESFQNYDEAFPPLATDRSFEGSTTDVFVGETVGLRPRVASSSWLNGKRPAEARLKSAAASNCDHGAAAIDDDTKMDDDQDTSAPAQGDGSPVKRPKLLIDLIESETGGRTLHSCPDFVHSSGTTGSVCTGKRATFCCPVVKKQSSASYPTTAGVKIPPQFIIPKCWKVGSWPSRYDRSTKPAGDVPFWSCSEWFCTVHKRLEFGLLNAKINGDTKSLAASSAPAIANASCCGIDRTTSAVNIEPGSQMDLEIFEIEPSLPPPPPQVQLQQSWSSSQIPGQKQQEIEQQQAQVVPEMFDAPRFILHIINEDDTVVKENFFPPPKQDIYPNICQAIKNASPSSDWASFFDLGAADEMLFPATQKMCDAQYGNDNSSPWAAPAAHSEFSFDAMDDSCNVDTVSSAGILLPVDVSRLASGGGVGFCLPKCVSSVTQQQQRQQQFLMPPATTAAGVFNKLLETQATEGTVPNENPNPKQQPQSVAVPIRENTHFRPIRSESMEDAYYLKPGFDEVSAAIENIEGYHVYQHKDESGAAVITASVQQATATKNNGGQQKRSLALKFRAAKPDKMCQTEESSQDLAGGEEGTADVTTLLDRYRQEFEIWAFQPSEMRNCMNMSRWNLNESSDSSDAMVVGPLSPHIDDGWLDELVGDSPPPPQPKMVRDEQPLHPAIGFGLGVDGSVFQQQPPKAQASKGNGPQQLEIWQQEDERYEDSLLRYVSNISLISPLDIQTTTV